MFERDKSELRDLGIPLETGPANRFSTVEGYRINRTAYELPRWISTAAQGSRGGGRGPALGLTGDDVDVQSAMRSCEPPASRWTRTSTRSRWPQFRLGPGGRSLLCGSCSRRSTPVGGSPSGTAVHPPIVHRANRRALGCRDPARSVVYLVATTSIEMRRAPSGCRGSASPLPRWARRTPSASLPTRTCVHRRCRPPVPVRQPAPRRCGGRGPSVRATARNRAGVAGTRRTCRSGLDLPVRS